MIRFYFYPIPASPTLEKEIYSIKANKKDGNVTLGVRHGTRTLFDPSGKRLLGKIYSTDPESAPLTYWLKIKQEMWGCDNSPFAHLFIISIIIQPLLSFYPSK